MCGHRHLTTKCFVCECCPLTEEGMALLVKAAGQGHAYAMCALGSIHCEWEEHQQATAWFTKGAEAGLPNAIHNLAVALDMGKGVAAPDYPAAAGWYRRAADAGIGDACVNLGHMYISGRGRAWRMMPASSLYTLVS